MTSRTRLLGGAQPAVIVSILAVLIVGGTYLFMGKTPEAVNAQDSGVKAAPTTPLEKPEVAAESVPRVSPDADNIMRGEMIKYRDENGRVHFRVREPVEGTTSNGKTTYWHLDAYLGPQVKSISGAEKAKFARSKKPKAPRYVMQDGKLVPNGK